MVKQVQIVLWDDLDHYQQGIDTPADDTYTFGWAGQDWEIDLTETHFKEMAELLRPWLECARPAEKKNTGSGQPNKRNGRYSTTRKPDGSVDWAARKVRTQQLQRVRKWAVSTGYDLSARGIMPIRLQQAYNRAHPDDQIQVIGSNGPVDE